LNWESIGDDGLTRRAVPEKSLGVRKETFQLKPGAGRNRQGTCARKPYKKNNKGERRREKMGEYGTSQLRGKKRKIKVIKGSSEKRVILRERTCIKGHATKSQRN